MRELEGVEPMLQRCTLNDFGPDGVAYTNKADKMQQKTEGRICLRNHCSINEKVADFLKIYRKYFGIFR